MELLHYKEFLAIVETKSFEKAAEQLFTTQSTLSKHIAKMERELYVKLFDRSARRVQLTEAGQQFLPYAQQMLRLEGEYLAVLRAYQPQAACELNIGAVFDLVAYRINTLLADFQQAHPDIRLHIYNDSPIIARRRLLEGKTELAFLRYSPDRDEMGEFSILPYTQDQLVAVCAAQDPLAQQRQISLQALENRAVLGFPEQSFMQNLILTACAEAGFVPKISFSTGNTENLIALSAQGLGVSLLMKKMVLHSEHTGICVLDIVPPSICNIDICSVKGRRLSPAAQLFLRYLKQRLPNGGAGPAC